MMTLPPSKKTAPEQGSLCADKLDPAKFRSQPEEPPKLHRRVNVEQAAAYAGISRAKMYELIELGVVISGHRPGTNRRWVDLDSVDELYQSPERLRIAEELARNRRKKVKDRGK